MSRVSRDEDSPVFECRRGDDEIGVVVRMAAPSTDHPEIRGSIEDGIRHGEDGCVLTEDQKSSVLSRRGLVKVSAENFVPGHRGEGELSVSLSVVERLVPDRGITEFDDLGKDVSVEEGRIHWLPGNSTEIGALADGLVEAIDVLVAHSLVHVPPGGHSRG